MNNNNNNNNEPNDQNEVVLGLNGNPNFISVSLSILLSFPSWLYFVDLSFSSSNLHWDPSQTLITPSSPPISYLSFPSPHPLALLHPQGKHFPRYRNVRATRSILTSQHPHLFPSCPPQIHPNSRLQERWQVPLSSLHFLAVDYAWNNVLGDIFLVLYYFVVTIYPNHRGPELYKKRENPIYEQNVKAADNPQNNRPEEELLFE